MGTHCHDFVGRRKIAGKFNDGLIDDCLYTLHLPSALFRGTFLSEAMDPSG